jgi:alpha-amylase
MWPGTKEWVVQQGYLHKLFDALSRERDWLEVIHLGQAVKLVPARGRVYLPESSYPEMMEWAQPTEMEIRFTR